MPLEATLARFGYAAARADFRARAAARGYRLSAHLLPGHTGPGGEDLTIDVAQLGPDDPDALLVVLSGTHGAEGLAGSHCQRVLIERPVMAPAGVGVLLIHAVNPYGFAHLTRTNENNVDLNRNGLSDFADCPRADAYGQLHDWFVPSAWTAREQDVPGAIARVGQAAFQAAATGGQYDWPDGLFYGGREPQWSRRILEQICARAFRGVGRIALIDVHTGLGAYGEGEIIYTGAATDRELASSRALFAGLDVVCPDEGGSVSAHITGPQVDIFRQAASDAVLGAVALEFGVRDFAMALNALRRSAWLRIAPHASAQAAAEVRADMVRAFFADDPLWLERVESRFLEVVDAALANL
jgi:hypothetical protein